MCSNIIPMYTPIILYKPSKLHCVKIILPSTLRSRTLIRCNLNMNVRRSGNYKPSLWDFDYIQSLRTNEYTEEKYSRRASELTMQVKKMLDKEMDVVQQLELIDDLQRLGISYHFNNKIDKILNRIYVEHKMRRNEDDLYSTALEFRILRQHGFKVSQEVFDIFKNEEGDFKQSLGDNAHGLLQLYEASFLLTEGEDSLEIAREFATMKLHHLLHLHQVDQHLSLLIPRALELPLHWRAERPNARWFIDAYETRPDMNPTLLQLAKLDFNILQATHQQELTHVSRWWKQTWLAETLPFARDRVVECYLWTIGGLFQPQYEYSRRGYSRIMVTKLNLLITVMDDIFDAYATLDELLLFNNVIQRWDVEAMDELPRYMQMCFLALNNFINEMAYDFLKEQGFLIIPHLRKSWADLCTAYTQEANWYSTGHTPTLEEYMKNAWISTSAPVILSHAFFLITNPIQEHAVQTLYNYHNIVQYSAMLLRLANDLGTSPDEMNRGDVPKSVQCYMKENNAGIEEAREYVKSMIYETWKKMNKERVSQSPFSQEFITSAVNLGRISQYMYQHGDDHGIQNDPQVKNRISTLMFEPINNV
uniref:Terpene synthase 6 n=1 Tax=Scutellaria barbata TaxID=396367 RepID=A0A6B7LYZ7_9LAMI|nr:terpene synthase 6 [Scutellaria barbata]